MTAKRAKDKSVLSKQDIASRRNAIAQKKMSVSDTGKRAIAGVAILTLSVMALLAVATFDARDRVGPGFHNAIGPVGHAIAEAMRGFLGLCAFVLPMAGLYTSFLIFVGERGKRRWPQVLCLGLLVVAGAVLAQLMFRDDASWAHAPGGLLGRTLSDVLTGLFSTVGTVVLVSAICAVALIVGTQFYFLRACALAWEGLKYAATKAHAWGLVFLADQKKRLEERKVSAEKAREEEAAFLAQLEEEEAELSELEAAVNEADAIAQENERALAQTEAQKLAKLAEKEAARLQREAERTQREAERLGRQMFKEAQAQKKDQQRTAPAPMPLLTAAPAVPMAAEVAESNGDPAWALSLAPTQVPAKVEVLAQSMPSEPPPPRVARTPNIVQAQQPQVGPPPPPIEALLSFPPMSASEFAASQSSAAAEVVAGASALVSSSAAVAPEAAAAGLSALAISRMPLIVEPKAPPKPTAKKAQDQFEFVGDRKSFAAPPIDVLEMNQKVRSTLDKDQFLATAEKLRAKLADFGIVGEVVEIRPGPVVTMYEFLPGPGIKISKIASLADDLAMAMEAMRVRIVAPIPGKGVVGIEVPNKDRETVFLKEVAEQDAFQKSASKLTMCLGKDIEGMPYVFDLAKAPHLLMAGTTGSGKSVAVNAMIMSILLKSTPEEVRFIMVDPKMLELSVYEGIPHLLLPVVTDPRKAAIALQWAVDEMTRRYRLLSEAGVRNITGYNALVDAEKKKKEKPAPAKHAVIDVKAEKAAQVEAPKVEVAAAPPPAPVADGPKKKKRLLIVDVAEAAPAPEAASAEVAAAPAPGSDMGVPVPTAVLDDPREGLTPVVEAELKQVEKETEIRVDHEATAEETAALEAAAADQPPEAAEPAADDAATDKVKLPYIVVIIDELADLMMVASKEVETSVARLAQMARAAGIHLMVATQRPSTDVVTGIIKANFPTRISFMLRSKPDSMTILGTVGAEALLGMGDMLIMPPTSAHLQRVHGCFVSEAEIKRAVDHLKAQGKPVYDENILKARDEEEGAGEGEEDELSDELYDQAIAIVSEMRNVSISMLQRKMRIGYNRAARMIERMERDGLVGAADGAKPREVLARPLGQMPGAGAMA